ncbi:MAG: hypothetical protein AB1782_05845 [Cyanobacteriota bacterium]
MKSFLQVKFIVIITGTLIILFPQKACAYLDPGTGSFVIQIIIATLAGITFSIKIFWSNIKLFFLSLFSKKEISEIDNGDIVNDSGPDNNESDTE